MTHKKSTLAAAAVASLAIAFTAWACPFCSVESQTLSEETQSSDTVVLAKLVKEAPPAPERIDDPAATDPESGMATFKISEVLKGEAPLAGGTEIKAVYFGEPDRERTFLIIGLGSEKIDWTTPLPLSPAAVEYVRKLGSVPASGVERLAFFQEYLEHEDPLLAQDAYDEFARAPYADVQALGPKMQHDKLVKWVADLDISPSRRRLYYTMLGVCGTKDDLPLLESMILADFDTVEPHWNTMVGTALSAGAPIGLAPWLEIVEQDERRKKLGLDALVACYLTLRGADGLDLIDQRFLKNPKAEYTHVYSTIMALRFHGDEDSSSVPRERLLTSMRLLLDNPDFADQVILDLSRWDDWSVLDRLTEMFKTANEENAYVRQPIVTYLTVASEQPGDVGKRATAALAELEQLDPKTVEQARSLMAFGALGRARAAADDTSNASDDAKDAEKSAADEQAFAASTEDEATDVSDVPDPAAYEERDTPTTASKTAQVSANKPTTPPDEISEPAELNTMLVVGVPLVAAALLMGIYWLILRVGAV